MANIVVNTAMVKCAGAVPPGIATLTIINPTITASDQGIGTINDNVAFTNIATFGQCNLSSNPTVAAATAAASGVHTPMPCIPNIAAPWAAGSSTVMVSDVPALSDDSTLMCNWGGSISIEYAGQVITTV